MNHQAHALLVKAVLQNGFISHFIYLVGVASILVSGFPFVALNPIQLNCVQVGFSFRR